MRAMPSALVVIRAESTPSTPSTAPSTSSGVSRVTTWTGSLVPAGKDSPSRSAAEMASGRCRNWSAGSRPVVIEVVPIARSARAATVPATKVRGRLATASPTRRHTPRESTSTGSPTRGTLGQKTQRPKSTSAAGSTTSAKVAAITTPTAQARPRPRVVGIAESSRVSRPSTTVVELDTTASVVRASAWAIASWRESVVFSSSR